MKPLSLAYRITAEKERDYHHVTVTFLHPRRFSFGRDFEALLSLRWQSDSSNFAAFYGLSFKLEMEPSYASEFTTIAAKAGKLAAKLEGLTEPRAVLEKLAALKIPRVSYDARLSSYVMPDEAPNPTHRRFMDDYQIQPSGTGCSVAVIAPNAEEAKHLMLAEWTKRLAAHHHAEEARKFSLWFSQGQPVLLDTHSTTLASFPDLAEILNEPAPTEQPESVNA